MTDQEEDAVTDDAGRDDQPHGGAILARATVSLPGVRVGDVGDVDPDSPYIAGCLRRGFLVAVGDVEEQLEPPAEREEPEAAAPEQQEEVSSDEVDLGLEDAAVAEPD